MWPSIYHVMDASNVGDVWSCFELLRVCIVCSTHHKTVDCPSSSVDQQQQPVGLLLRSGTGSRYRSTAAVAAWRAVFINFGTTLRRFDVFVASWSATVVSPVAWFLISDKGHLYIFLQVARRIYKGIPEKMRGLVWSLLLGIEQEAKKNAGVYEVSYLMRDNYMHMYVYNKLHFFYTHGYFSTSRIYTVSQKKQDT